VAEDNEALRGLLRDMLTAYGYRVIEAADGADAIDKFKEAGTADLLILDSVMPKKNGREAYNEIHEIKPGIKVLFTSGYTRDVVLHKGIEDETFDFMSKPISPGVLLQKVREILDEGASTE
jgi:two-component system cell cycle sensor histidine kinase/response regulator CckA